MTEKRYSNSKLGTSGTYYYANDGKEIAHWMSEREQTKFGRAQPETLAFNSDRMKIPCYDKRAETMSYIDRIDDRYREECLLIIQKHQGAQQTEYFNC